jgi:hypothetical protein
VAVVAVPFQGQTAVAVLAVAAMLALLARQTQAAVVVRPLIAVPALLAVLEL